MQDSTGRIVTSWQQPVQMSVLSGQGRLVGTTTVTSVGGIARFSGISVAGVGQLRVRFSSGQLAAADTTLLISADVLSPTSVGLTAVPDSAREAAGVYTFSAASSASLPDSGSILVGSAGEGYLRRVVKSERTGNNIAVQTSEASLADLAVDGVYADSGALDLSAIAPLVLVNDQWVPARSPITQGTIRFENGKLIADDVTVFTDLNGQVVLDHFELSLKPTWKKVVTYLNGDLEKVEFSIGGNAAYSADLRFSTKGSVAWSQTLKLFCLTPPSVPPPNSLPCPGIPLPPLPIGPIPIPNSISLDIGWNLRATLKSAATITKHLEGTANFSGGARYTHATGSLAPTADFSAVFSGTPLVFEETETIVVGSGPVVKATWKIAGIPGPYVTLAIPGLFEVTPNPATQSYTEVCRLVGVASGGIAVKIFKLVNVSLAYSLPEIEILRFCEYVRPYPKAPVASVTVTPASTSLSVGGSQQLTATLRDAGGAILTGRQVSWTSSNSSVANVSTGGSVVGLTASNSPVTITATSEGRTGTASITVTPQLEPIAVTSAASGVATSSFTMNGSVNPQGLTPVSTLFERFAGTSCSGTATTVAQANIVGGGNAAQSRTQAVTGLTAGTGYSYRMAASRSGGTTQRGACVSVTTLANQNEALQDLAVAPPTATLTVGQTVSLTPSPSLGGSGVSVTYSWSSSNPAVATVSTTGVVTGLSVGSATITVSGTGSGAGFVTSSRSATSAITVSSSSGSCVWCNATLSFDGNTIPSGWQQARFGPNSASISNGRIESTATDRGLAFRANGSPPPGTNVIEVTTEGTMVDVFFGMNNNVRLETGTTSWQADLASYTCQPSNGCATPAGLPNQLVLSSYRVNGYVFPNGGSSSTLVSRFAATYTSGTVLRVTREFFDDNVILTVRRLSDNALITSRQLSLPGFRVANVTGAGFHFYFTSGSTTSLVWLDNVAFRFLNQPSTAAPDIGR